MKQNISFKAECAVDKNLRDYLAKIGKYPRISAQKELELDKLIKEGSREAEQQLIKANLRLVVSEAKRYQGQGVLLIDLIQEGNLGLMKAVKTFDYTKGYKLSTYAVFLIRRFIISSIRNTSKVIRLPHHVHQKLEDLRKAKMKLGENIDLETLSSVVHLSSEKIKELESVNQTKFLSLNHKPYKDEEMTYCEIIPSKINTESDFDAQDLAKNVNQLISTLDKDRQYVIKERFGFNGEPKKHREIGCEFGKTKQWAYVLEKTAIHKMRKMVKSDESYRDLLDKKRIT